jgi:hypothetical protein
MDCQQLEASTTRPQGLNEGERIMAKSGQQASATWRGQGMQEICHMGGKPGQCNRDMTSELLHTGAGRYDHVASGFEGCLDAPTYIPTGSTQYVGSQPYMD